LQITSVIVDQPAAFGSLEVSVGTEAGRGPVQKADNTPFE
jgi:hypothetical protein